MKPELPVSETAPFAASEGAVTTTVVPASTAHLQSVVAEYLANFLSERTREAYRGDFRDFALFLARRNDLAGASHPREITRSHVIAYRDELRERFASTTINRKLSALSSLFFELQDARIVEKNPVEGVRRPESKIKRPRSGFTDAEVTQILESFDASDVEALQHKTLFAFLFYTGARVSEMLAVRVRDLEIQNHVPVVHLRGKGDKHRALPLHPKLNAMIRQLAEQRGKSGEEFLFTRLRVDSSAALSRDAVHKLIKATLVRLKLDASRSCHSSRRTLVSNLLESGARLEVVQKIAGHASPTTTVKYNVRTEKIEDNPLLTVRY